MDHLAVYLGKSSDRFRQVYSELERVIEGVFPRGEQAFAYKMPGFRVKVSGREITGWKGTIDPNYLQIFLVERKSGITLHIWNPLDFYGLDKRREELTQAGFRVMRGCLQWNTKRAYPMETVKGLLESIQRQFTARP